MAMQPGAVAPPRAPLLPPTGSGAPDAGGGGGGGAAAAPLPFSSLPGWPQPHLLHHLHQGQSNSGAAAGNQVVLDRMQGLENHGFGYPQPQGGGGATIGNGNGTTTGPPMDHVYLQHAMHFAQQQQRAAKQQQAGYLQLQSAMSGMNPSERERVLAQLAKQAPQIMQQQQRVPAFLFGAPTSTPGSTIGNVAHHGSNQQTQLPPRSNIPQQQQQQQQQFIPEMIQARMMAMHKPGDGSPHLRLGTPDSTTSSPAPVNGLPVVHANGDASVRPGSGGGFVFPHSPDQRPPQMNPQMNLHSKPSPELQHQRPQFFGTSVPPPPPVSTSLQINTGAPAPLPPSSGATATIDASGKSYGFTLQQLKVLRAQILAFRRLKRGEHFSNDMIRVITPPPLPSAVLPPSPAVTTVTPVVNVQPAGSTSTTKLQDAAGDEVHQPTKAPEEEASRASTIDHPPASSDTAMDAGVTTAPLVVVGVTPVPDDEKKAESEDRVVSGKSPSKKYHGPMFDFPAPGKPAETPSSWGAPLNLGYDATELLTQEGERIINRKRTRKLKVVEMLLLEDGADLPSEMKLKLRIEQKKMVLLGMQGRVRNEVEDEQQEIMAMGDRAYRKFVRLCERQRLELARSVMAISKTSKDKYLKAVFLWRKKLLEAHWAARDARLNRNRGVVKYHDRLMREFSKRKDEDRSKRMEALKNNDVDAYREMLIKQQKEIPGDAKQRFEVLSSFLTQTEDYLHKLGGKISAVKEQQEKEEAALAAAASAKAQGLSEEDVERAATQASELVASKSWKYMDHPNKYYNLAHAVSEQILRQPSMLRAGILRDYQLVGLQWMLSLYNNRLNGILADEMGLGKTVQVMALIAYLMEFKGNYGPHLIIVPNAVIVNWKSELLRWLPSVSCIFYVGVREERSRIYSQEVAALKFNVLVTTYEFIMRDRSKLAKVDWKYIIIDEAQRMKDRESRLARDLDRFRCQRRLLLTGTPLQNDLHELWSLLNLLLPEVFDNSKAFHDWFSKPFQKEAQSLEDDWLETEKKVIVIHRLHQILEPFMLRRRVEDVEGSLPPKVAVVLKCKMSYHQAAIYDWVKATGTIRLDPAEEELRLAGGTKRQIRAYAPLQNKCMELRKVCNHPYLNYPPRVRVFHENVVRMCGKLWILDRILIKLQKSGHRVLLFSTMTKLLDILEDYLQWRGLIYRRIDGTTPLDSRESAIVDFNAPGSQCFIFLLSIRAAGRGLNLQTADTVVIYDPDPNPKNEEQAVARAHRIGQKNEVKVIYMEAVVETLPCYHKEDEIRNGGTLDAEDDMAGKDRYMGSVESLVRNNIQQHKIDMADEVINAGRFDQRTTHEERRITLEALLHDEERYQESVHDVPTLKEVNRMISRSDEEVELFDRMDEECDWPGEMIGYDEVPEWLHVGSDEVTGAIKATSKQSMMRGISGISGIVGTKAEEDKMLAKKKRKGFRVAVLARKVLKPAAAAPVRRGRPPLNRVPEVEEPEDEEDGLGDEESSSGDEEGEIRSEDEEENVGRKRPRSRPVESDEDDAEAAGSSEEREEESPETQTEVRFSDFKKFGSLAELGGRSQQQEGEDLEEGEILASGGAGEHPESPPSENWVQEEDGTATKKGKRSRSTRPRRRIMGNVPVQEVYPVGYLPPTAWTGFNGVGHSDLWTVRPGTLPVPVPVAVPGPSFIHSSFPGWNPPGGLKQIPVLEETTVRAARASGPRMPDNVQKKCKAVLNKLQGAVNRDGRHVSALLMELPRHHDFPDYYKIISKPIDAKTIEEHLERFDYATVLDFASDVQLMLDNASRYNSSNAEVQADARRLHSLFFQRMGLMFPDVNFNTIKSNIGLPVVPSGSRSSRKQRQVFPEVGRLADDPPPPPPPTSTSKRSSKKDRESSTKLRVVLKGSDRSGTRVVDRGSHFHPADLVVTRRRRSIRRRLRPKGGVSKRKRGAQAAAIVGPDGRKARNLLEAGGPLTWARARTIASAMNNNGGGEADFSYRGSGGDGGGGVPRKKMRTDTTGRRRPGGRP